MNMPLRIVDCQKKSYSKGLVGADYSLSIGEFFTLIVSHASTTMLRSAILRVGREEKEKVLDPLSTGSDALKPIDCRKRRLSRFAETTSLAAAKVPLLHVCGDADEVVPFEENSALLATRYRELGGPITVIAKPGVKHHPHSLQDPEVIVSFILKHTH